MKKTVLGIALACLTATSLVPIVAQADTQTANPIFVTSTQLGHGLPQFPTTSEINSVEMFGDTGGEIRFLVPKDSVSVASKVLSWLKSSSVLNATLPESAFRNTNGGNNGNADLVFQTSTGASMSISPAYYTITNGKTRNAYRIYLKNVVIYNQTGMESPQALRSSALYKYLKSQWRIDFG